MTDTQTCHRPFVDACPPADALAEHACPACGGDRRTPALVAVVDTDALPDDSVPLETARAAWQDDADDQADSELDGPPDGWGAVIDGLYPNLASDAGRREADERAAGPWRWTCHACQACGVQAEGPSCCPACGHRDTLTVAPVPAPPVLDAHQAEGPAAAAAYWAAATVQPEDWTDALRPPGGDEGTPMAPAEVILRHLVVDAIDRHACAQSADINAQQRGRLVGAPSPSQRLWPWLQLPEALAAYLDGLVREHAAAPDQVG